MAQIEEVQGSYCRWWRPQRQGRVESERWEAEYDKWKVKGERVKGER